MFSDLKPEDKDRRLQVEVKTKIDISNNYL